MIVATGEVATPMLHLLSTLEETMSYAGGTTTETGLETEAGVEAETAAHGRDLAASPTETGHGLQVHIVERPNGIGVLTGVSTIPLLSDIENPTIDVIRDLTHPLGEVSIIFCSPSFILLTILQMDIVGQGLLLQDEGSALIRHIVVEPCHVPAAAAVLRRRTNE